MILSFVITFLLIMACTVNDYVTIIIVLGGFIISEILPHCPGVEANGIVHFLALLLKQLAESNIKIGDDQPK